MEPILYNSIVIVLASAAMYLLYKVAAAHAELKSLKKVVAELDRGNAHLAKECKLMADHSHYQENQILYLRIALDDDIDSDAETKES